MNILYGGSEGIDSEICENCKSLGEFLLKKFQEADDNILLVDGISGKELRARELSELVINLAKNLQQHFGIKSGDVISICSENRIEFGLTIYAAFLIGATVAPLNNTYTEREINHAINLSKPRIAFVSESNYDKYLKVKSKHSFIVELITFTDEKCEFNSKNSFKAFDQLLKPNGKSRVFICEPQRMKENVALILCSSGTTGLPKGVQLTQYNLLIGNVQFYDRPSRLEGPPGNGRIVLGNLPLFHAFGICVFVTSAMQRSKIVLLPRFTETDFLRCIDIYKVTTLFAVPPIMIFLAKSPLIDNYNLTSLHVIWCGAAPLSKELEIDVQKRLGLKTIRQGYGMTEGTFAMCAQNDYRNASGSVGVVLKGVHGRVIDLKTGFALGPHLQGEIQFKGNCIMKGYIGNIQATNAIIDTAGWLHTGDIGYYDEHGEWYIVDRLKELIKYKGYQVPPAEIEALLLTNEHIRDVGVVGIPDELCGELPFAFIVRQPHSKITQYDVIKFVADRVSPPKRLHGGVKFLDAIPKNASGKILRRILREMTKNCKSQL